ncbi:uncharacterized protein LOC129598353 [Paramacrobiotus metropolitanus]|uniref:uncharacterized protein LOC129598353 n=1 Tax=Paramacrobiotus metropolitanus TaxID=2943436 RepID=UPI0024457626|nr:uncharacterized protein LOC129598353 [Paramacrobiotus metropolitanus]
MPSRRHLIHIANAGSGLLAEVTLLVLLLFSLECDGRAVGGVPRQSLQQGAAGGSFVSRHVEVPDRRRKRRDRGDPAPVPVLHPFVYGLMDGFLESTAEAVISEDTYGYGRPAAAADWFASRLRADHASSGNDYFSQPFEAAAGDAEERDNYAHKTPPYSAKGIQYSGKGIGRQIGQQFAQENYYQDQLKDLQRPSAAPYDYAGGKSVIGLPGYYFNKYVGSSGGKVSSVEEGYPAPVSAVKPFTATVSIDKAAPSSYIDVAKANGIYTGYKDYNAANNVDTRDFYNPAEMAPDAAAYRGHGVDNSYQQPLYPANGGYGYADAAPPVPPMQPGWTAEQLYGLVADTIILSWILDL